MHRLLACGRAAAEANDVAIWVLDIEALRAPLGRRDRLDDRHAVGDALLVERLDAVNARRDVEMIVVATVLAVCVVRGRFLQVKFQSVQNTDGVEPFPWLAEREADLLVVRDRALKVVDKELWSKDVTRGFIVLLRPNPANKRAPAGMGNLRGGYDLFG